jgi:hypothetical protein
VAHTHGTAWHNQADSRLIHSRRTPQSRPAPANYGSSPTEAVWNRAQQPQHDGSGAAVRAGSSAGIVSNGSPGSHTGRVRPSSPRGNLLHGLDGIEDTRARHNAPSPGPSAPRAMPRPRVTGHATLRWHREGFPPSGKRAGNADPDTRSVCRTDDARASGEFPAVFGREQLERLGPRQGDRSDQVVVGALERRVGEHAQPGLGHVAVVDQGHAAAAGQAGPGARGAHLARRAPACGSPRACCWPAVCWSSPISNAATWPARRNRLRPTSGSRAGPASRATAGYLRSGAARLSWAVVPCLLSRSAHCTHSRNRGGSMALTSGGWRHSKTVSKVTP